MKRILLWGVLLAVLTGALPLVCLLLPRENLAAGEPVPSLEETQTTPAPEEEWAAEESADLPPTDYLDPLLIWDGDAQVVRTVEVLDYLIGAAASEMPVDWPAQAIQAQMVASHSWALYCRDHRDGSNGGAYFTASPQRREGYMTREVMEAYWGDSYEENYAYLEELAREVLDQVVTWEGAPAGTFYHAISTGATTDSGQVWGQSLPYLCGVDSPWDTQAPDFEMSVALGAQRVSDCLTSSFGLVMEGSPGQWLGDQEFDSAGYCTAIQAGGQSLSGISFRTALGLRSAAFTYSYDPTCGEFTFTTRGYGHGVGMSQWGARAMALEGSSWQEILAHYFPGTQITAARGE